MKKITLFVLMLISGSSLLAQNWTGAVSSDWNNSANWSLSPSSGDDIIIDPLNYTGVMAHPIITNASNFSPGKMLIQNGAHLTIAGDLNASDRVDVLGEGTLMTITSGTFALNGAGNNARLVFTEDSHLQMEGGSLISGQRLLFELGAEGEINAGTIVVGETIALIDGGLNGSSRLVQHGGSITTNGEFGFENEAGEYYPAFEQTGGELHVNGSLFWLGIAPGSGRGSIHSIGGTIFVTGTIGNDPTSTMGMHIELSGATTLLENTGTAVVSLSGDSIVLLNEAQWYDINTVNWQNAGVVHAASDAFFRSGNTTLNGTGSYQFDHLAVPAFKLLNHVSPAVISVSGDLAVEGTFNHANNKLVLNGMTHQSVTALAGSINLFDLQVNNAANGILDGGYGITLNTSLNINHSLELTDGILIAVPSTAVKLAATATVIGGTDTTFVEGYMEKTGNEAIEFPLGSAPDRYRPFAISAPATASTVVSVAYKFESYGTLTPVETPMQTVSTIEYWDVSRSGSLDLFTVAVGWNNAAQSGLTNCNDITLSTWDGTQWVFVPSTTTGLCDGSNTGTLNSSGQLPVVSPVTIGFTENVYQYAVEVCAGESVTVGGNTYTLSGVYTDVLTDVSGNDSTVITILTVEEPFNLTVTNNVTHLVASATNVTYFQWINCDNGNSTIAGETNSEFYPAVNGSYAVIISRNGCSDTSECVVISELGLMEATPTDVQVYPNPVESNGKLIVTLIKVDSVEICTLDGRILQPLSINIEKDAVSIELIGLLPGTYFVKGIGGSGQAIMKKFIVL